MSVFYPEDFKPFSSGLTNHWGSLYGSSEALALLEFAESQKRSFSIHCQRYCAL